MKKKICKSLIAVLIAGMLIGTLPVMAQEDAKSIDDMTFEELKIAYLELQLEYEKLKNEVNTSAEEEAYNEEEAADAALEIAAGEYSEPVLMDEYTFLDDIVNSYNARSLVAARYSSEEMNAMSAQERADYYYECASAEEDFYTKYQNAVFEDEGISALCSLYVEGIREQLESCEIYYETGDEESLLKTWNAGYRDRAAVIVELADDYGLSFGDITEMRSGVEAAALEEAMDSTGEGTDSYSEGTDSGTVQYVQELLNDLGFSCGEADGVYGQNTVDAIEQFRELYGYLPFDGVIDDELIGQLEDALGIAQ